MPREKPPEPDTSGDIPAWFMTYSDVITLLMTFFILLLTFASQEPESFERVKVSMFGGGGSDGIAGRKNDAMDRESVALRYRPEKSRLSQNGTETPPLNEDPTRDGAGEGLKTLDEDTELANAERFTFAATMSQFLAPDGEILPSAQSQLTEMAKQMLRFQMQLSISVPAEADLPGAIKMAHQFNYGYGVSLGSVAVSVQPNPQQNKIEFSMVRSSQ